MESTLPRLSDVAPETNALPSQNGLFSPKNACLTTMSPLRHRLVTALFGAEKCAKAPQFVERTRFLASLSQ